MSYKPNDPRAKLGESLMSSLGKRSERRAGARFLAPPLAVTIDRITYQTVDWGLGALVVGGFDREVPDGRKLKIAVALPDQEAPPFVATVQVIRRTPGRRQIVLQFVEMQTGMLGWLGDLQLHGDIGG